MKRIVIARKTPGCLCRRESSDCLLAGTANMRLEHARHRSPGGSQPPLLELAKSQAVPLMEVS